MKEKGALLGVVDDKPFLLKEIVTLLAQLPEADRVELLRYIIQPMDQVALSEVLQAVAHRLASGELSFAITDPLIQVSKRNQTDQLAFN
jgi:hypothetical protein